MGVVPNGCMLCCYLGTPPTCPLPHPRNKLVILWFCVFDFASRFRYWNRIARQASTQAGTSWRMNREWTPLYRDDWWWWLYLDNIYLPRQRKSTWIIDVVVVVVELNWIFTFRRWATRRRHWHNNNLNYASVCSGGKISSWLSATMAAMVHVMLLDSYR